MRTSYKKLIISLIILFSIIFLCTIFYLFNSSAKNGSDTNEYNNIIDILPNDTDSSIINTNYVKSASYSDTGFNLNIYIEGDNPKLIIYGKEAYEIDLSMISSNNYNATINVDKLNNDKYTIYVKTDKVLPLINKLDLLDQIVRSKIENKLITFNYTNNNMSFTLEDFKYEYDILIDPGHGGIDPGTSNSIISEAKLNLIQSLYEKNRYEEHGLKVLLSRNDDTSGMMMGDINWNRAKQRGYAIGYYGVTAKLVYSNHHNASENTNSTGFEILVSNKYNETDLFSEIKILNELLEKYNKNYQTNKLKMYSRDLDTGAVYNKSSGKIYDYTDYYATIRIPLELYNVKTVTYEGCYMTNKNNFNWYYNEGYKIMSEVKIKYYVEALGKTYIKP